MNPNEPTNSPGSNDERVLQTLHGQQRRLRWLTAVGVAFWVLAVVTSIGVLVCYSVFYAPKERQILDDYGTAGHLRDTARPPAADATGDQRSANIEKALGVHFTMNYVVTKGLLAVAISVFILSLSSEDAESFSLCLNSEL